MHVTAPLLGGETSGHTTTGDKRMNVILILEEDIIKINLANRRLITHSCTWGAALTTLQMPCMSASLGYSAGTPFHRNTGTWSRRRTLRMHECNLGFLWKGWSLPPLCTEQLPEKDNTLVHALCINTTRSDATSAPFLTLLALISIEAFKTITLVTVDGFNTFSILAGIIFTGS